MPVAVEMEPYLKEAICRTLGIRRLQAGWHEEKEEQGSYRKIYWIDYLWVATIDGYWWRNVTLGVIATSPEKRNPKILSYMGFIVLNLHEGETEVIHPLEPIPLGDFSDPIAGHLHHIDLLPDTRNGAATGQSIATYRIDTYRECAEGRLHFDMGELPADENGWAIWDKLMDLCLQFTHLKGDPVILDLVKSRRIR